jgi:hypothetical protein
MTCLTDVYKHLITIETHRAIWRSIHICGMLHILWFFQKYLIICYMSFEASFSKILFHTSTFRTVILKYDCRGCFLGSLKRFSWKNIQVNIWFSSKNMQNSVFWLKIIFNSIAAWIWLDENSYTILDYICTKYQGSPISSSWVNITKNVIFWPIFRPFLYIFFDMFFDFLINFLYKDTPICIH